MDSKTTKGIPLGEDELEPCHVGLVIVRKAFLTKKPYTAWILLLDFTLGFVCSGIVY